MGEPIDDGTESTPRRMIRLAEPIHAMTYYTPEIRQFGEHGFRGWWHAYFAYRPAPMGAVSAGVVTAAFYNFGPAMVARAVPSVWDVMAPTNVHELRLRFVDEALRRALGPLMDSAPLARIVALLQEAMHHCDVAARPVFGAYAALDWPDDPHLAVWQGCTLLREHRGDSHHIALASAGVSGVQSHVLMAAHGHGDMAIILPIRGWTEEQWEQAGEELVERGWLTADSELTSAGREARSAIERHTDELASGPFDRLGDGELIELERALEVLAGHLIKAGEVADSWPPPWLKAVS